MGRNQGKGVSVYMEEYLYDLCQELVQAGVYKSLSELVRHATKELVDNEIGWVKQRMQEEANKYGEDELSNYIWTGMVYLRVNARWLAMNKVKLGLLLEDINNNPMPHDELELKWGTTIEITNRQ